MDTNNMGNLLNKQIQKMVDKKKEEIMFNRSWKTFKKIQEQSKLEESLMKAQSKSAIEYNIKFGFGSEYKKKVVAGRTISMIVKAGKR